MASRGSRGLWLANEERKAKAADIKRDIEALEDIHQLLDGKEWGSDTLEQIAEVIRETGREIREPDYNGDEQ
jgi:hypothetical protein